MPKVYVAGPDVFRSNAREHFREVDWALRQYGFEPLAPFDIHGEQQVGDPREIYQKNIQMIKDCDIVMANITPFRGTEPDSGTCFEIGYAKALGKKLVLYAEHPTIAGGTVLDRTEEYFNRLGTLEIGKDEEDPVFPDGMKAENFGLPFNLMLFHDYDFFIFGDYRHAIEGMAMKMHDLLSN